MPRSRSSATSGKAATRKSGPQSGRSASVTRRAERSDEPQAAPSSITTALRLLMAFGPMEKSIGLSELARRTGIPKSSAHRLLNLMAESRFIRRTGDGRYALGFQLWELGLRVVSNFDLREISHPVIEWLHHLVGDAVHVAILDDDDVVYIDRLKSRATLQLFRRIGHRMPANATASGKAILAYSAPEVVERALSRKLRALTDKSLVTRADLLADLRLIKERGYACSLGETQIGIASIAVPFFGADGEPAGAISIVGPSSSITRGRLKGLAQLLHEGADRISKSLDYSVARNVYSLTQRGGRRTKANRP